MEALLPGKDDIGGPNDPSDKPHKDHRAEPRQQRVTTLHGVPWVWTPKKNCAVCGIRTYTMSAQVDNQLEVRRVLGPKGENQFVVQKFGGREALATCCTNCLKTKFDDDPELFKSWVRDHPTSTND